MEVIKKYLLKKLFLKRSFVVILPVLLFLGVLVPAHTAHAFLGLGGIFDSFGKIGDLIFTLPFLPWLIGFKLALSAAIMLLGFLPVLLSALVLNFVLGDHLIMLPYTSGGIVDIGWLITRDIANLMFIAIILVIAVATMLGQQERGIRLLPKLIGVALLVNFTKVIAGMVVDFANIVTNYFLKPVTNIGNLFIDLFGQETPAWQLAARINRVFTDFDLDALWNLVSEFSFSTLVGDVIGAVMIIVVGLLMAFTLLVFAAIFLVRYIAIWILVIFSPLAFAAMILPDTAKFAKQWWNEFIKWSFIGVGPAFILFLTAKIIKGKNDIVKGDELRQIAAQGDAFQQFFQPFYNIINDVLFWIVILVFMWMGLMATMAMNNKVSGLMVKGAMKGLKAAGGWAKGAATRRYGQGIQDVGTKITEKYGGGRLTGRLFRAAGKRIEETGRPDEKAWKEEEEKAKKRPDGMNRALLETTNNPSEYSAAYGALAEQDPDKLDELLKTPDGKRQAESMVKYMSFAMPERGKKMVENAPWLAEAAGHKLRTDGTDQDLLDKIEREELDEKDAKTDSFVRHMNKKKLTDNVRASWLEDENIVSGMEHRKDATPLDFATDPDSIAKLRKGLEERAGGTPEEKEREAMKKLAEWTRDKHIATMPTEIIENPEYLKALSEKTGRLTFGLLSKFVEHHADRGEEALNKLFENVQDNDLTKGTNTLGKLRNNPRIRELMREGDLSKRGEERRRANIPAMEAERMRRQGRPYTDTEGEEAAGRRRRAREERGENEEGGAPTAPGPEPAPQPPRAERRRGGQRPPRKGRRAQIDTLIRSPQARTNFRALQEEHRRKGDTDEVANMEKTKAAVIEQIGERAWLGQQATRGAEVPPETSGGGAGTFLGRL